MPASSIYNIAGFTMVSINITPRVRTQDTSCQCEENIVGGIGDWDEALSDFL